MNDKFNRDGQWQEYASDSDGDRSGSHRPWLAFLTHVWGFFANSCSKVLDGAYNGELEMLDDILEHDERVEHWMGGRWREVALVPTARTMFMGRPEDSKGVVAATNRRVLLLDKGIIGKHIIRLPYRDIKVMEYNEGLLHSGIKLHSQPRKKGAALVAWDLYFDRYRGQAEPLAETIRGHISDARLPRRQPVGSALLEDAEASRLPEIRPGARVEIESAEDYDWKKRQ